MPTHLPSLWLDPLSPRLASLLGYPLSTAPVRVPSPTACQLLCPTNSLLASPSTSGRGENSSPKLFVWFRAKKDKGIVYLAGHLHSVTYVPNLHVCGVPNKYQRPHWVCRSIGPGCISAGCVRWYTEQVMCVLARWQSVKATWRECRGGPILMSHGWDWRSLSLGGGAVPPGLTLSGEARFIVWDLRYSILREYQRSSRYF